MRTILNSSDISKLKFQVGIADSPKEIDEVYKLRYDIFNVELEEGIKENECIKRDIDAYDEYCDHLIVKDKDLIIATYRIHPSWKMNKSLGFYSETEFNIKKLNFHNKKVIEVGRACIHKDYRANILLALVWTALRQYGEENNIEGFFGVASVHKCSIEEVSALYYNFLKNKQLIDDGTVLPLDELKVTLTDYKEDAFKKELIGSLLKGYIKMGTKLYGKPVYDKIFGCYDFFIYLDMKEANWEYIKVLTSLINRIDAV